MHATSTSNWWSAFRTQAVIGRRTSNMRYVERWDSLLLVHALFRLLLALLPSSLLAHRRLIAVSHRSDAAPVDAQMHHID